ncbi:MAG: DNA-protecting protein DprA [Myxococcales bacterium]|nr:DNA-protecting protein DprA [Myxococcales bacterium]
MERWRPFDEEEARLALALLPGIGGKLTQRLLQRFGQATEIFAASKEDLLCLEGIGDTLMQRIFEGPPPAKLRQVIQRMRRSGIWLLALGDPDYPSALLQLTSPPSLLFGRGDRSQLRGYRGVSVVGTREPNAQGARLTQDCVTALCAHGYAVISGGARGIDACAHRETIRQGGQTWALLGCGVDVAYPPEHGELFTQIANQGGLLLSEFLPGESPEKGYFPRRNRLIAALSEAVVVVQCSQKSGALNTAEVALELQRPIATYPGRPLEPLAGGPHLLLRQGAWLIESGEELCQRLAGRQEQVPSQLGFWEPSAASLPSKKREKVRSLSLEGPLRRLWEHLPQDPLHIDDIAQGMGTSIQEVSAQLVELELSGLAIAYPGMCYSRG